MPTSQSSQAQFRLANSLIQNIHNLPPERVAEVDNFVEFLRFKSQPSQESVPDRALTRLISQASESSFASAWDNAEIGRPQTCCHGARLNGLACQ